MLRSAHHGEVRSLWSEVGGDELEASEGQAEAFVGHTRGAGGLGLARVGAQEVAEVQLFEAGDGLGVVDAEQLLETDEAADHAAVEAVAGIQGVGHLVLGGRRAVWGPLVGVTILILLPEIFRPLAQYRQAVYGLLLVLVMAFLPFGVYDTIAMKLHNRRLARAGMLKPKAG